MTEMIPQCVLGSTELQNRENKEQLQICQVEELIRQG